MRYVELISSRSCAIAAVYRLNTIAGNGCRAFKCRSKALTHIFYSLFLIICAGEISAELYRTRSTESLLYFFSFARLFIFFV